jgi:hypothetical protein
MAPQQADPAVSLDLDRALADAGGAEVVEVADGDPARYPELARSRRPPPNARRAAGARAADSAYPPRFGWA